MATQNDSPIVDTATTMFKQLLTSDVIAGYVRLALAERDFGGPPVIIGPRTVATAFATVESEGDRALRWTTLRSDWTTLRRFARAVVAAAIRALADGRALLFRPELQRAATA